MKIAFLLFTLSCSIITFGQNHQQVLDSIKNSITDKSTPEEKVKIHSERLSYCYRNSIDSITFFKVMKEFESEENCPDCPFIARNNLGHYFYEKNDLENSKKYFKLSVLESKSICDDAYNNSLSWLTQIDLIAGDYKKSKQKINQLLEYNRDKNPKARFNAYFLLGGIQREQGHTLSAINSFHYSDSCTSLFKDSGFQFICKSKVYNNLGNTFREIKDYTNAEYYFKKGIKFCQKTKFKDELPFLKLSLAILKADQKKYLESIEALNSLEEIFIKQQMFNYELGEVFFYKGICNSGLGNYKEALVFFDKAKKIYQAHGNYLVFAESIAYMANCHIELKELNKAAILLDSALSIANEIKIEPVQIRTLEYMIKLTVLNKQFEQSYDLIQIRDSLKEIMQSRVDKNRVIDRETQFQAQLKEEELKLLKANQIIDKEKHKRNSNLLIGVIVLSLLIGAVLFTLYRNRLKTSKKLKEIDKLKTRFFENISHEFRTPLTLIKLPLSQAIKDNKELNLKELNLMHNNASRLQNLIEDLLSLSELEAGKMKINKTEQDPFAQVKTLSSQFDSYAESKGINYHKLIERNSIKATYDKSVVDKVLANLISNAIKYSEMGGEVQISVTIIDQKLVMKVSDKGDGITPEDQDKIFERFYRVGESDEGKQGSGIGLALVKKILEINEGTIAVTSKINEGSTFTATVPLENLVQMPFVPEPTPTIKGSAFEQPRSQDWLTEFELSSKPQLLITEDNKELLEYISSLFENDFQIIQAKDGEEGMQLALKHVPDFIISDWMMPIKNGLEFCKSIKTNTVTSHIPFLLLTAKSTVEDKIEGYETGADAYFSKPFNFKELRSRIKGLIKQRQVLYEKFSNTDIPLSAPTTNSLDVAFWEKFKLYLKTNIHDSELTATQIAEHLGMSRMQLHRKLTSLTGQNLSAFIKNQRMNLASELLKDSSKRISDVCYEIGYEDQSAFARAFKKEFGVSPSKYRDNLSKR